LAFLFRIIAFLTKNQNSMKKLYLFIALFAYVSINQVSGQWSYNVNHIYNANSGNVGIGTGTSFAPTEKLHINNGSNTAGIMAESSYSGTSMKALGYFRIKNTATGDIFNMVLRKNGTVHEMLQSCYDASGSLWREFIYYNYSTRKYEMRNGVMDAEFKNTGNILFTNSGSVGIGTATPQSSALVDITSTSKGFLPPRMTASQRAAISSPAAGLLVFQIDAPSGYYYYTGTSWTALGASNTNIQSLTYPQGVDGIFVQFELSSTQLTYTVPTGYNLYLTSLANCYPLVNGTMYGLDGSGPLFPENVTLTHDLINCLTAVGFTGFLVPVSSDITPVYFKLDDTGTTYTVPAGKKLVLKSGTGQGSPICVNGAAYANFSGNWLFNSLTTLSNCNSSTWTPNGVGYTGYLIDN
jgi:hypothetical protein